jgi:hypothetical protein
LTPLASGPFWLALRQASSASQATGSKKYIQPYFAAA